MREIPSRADSVARQSFESYSDQQRLLSMKGFFQTAAASYGAVSASGPLALLVTVPLGMVQTWWGKKSYREEAYAYFRSMGLVQRPTRRIRSVFTTAIGGWRYPGGEIVADIIVDVLAEEKPELTEQELNITGLNALKTLRVFRLAHPDGPIELAADVILASHGIFRAQPEDQTQKEYVYKPHEAIDIHAVITRRNLPPTPKPPPEKPQLALYIGIGAGLLALMLIIGR